MATSIDLLRLKILSIQAMPLTETEKNVQIQGILDLITLEEQKLRDTPTPIEATSGTGIIQAATESTLSSLESSIASGIKFGDTQSVDAFSRLRVSSPSYLFGAQLTYDLQPLLYEPITNGSGATVTHDTTNRMALMTFSSTPTGGKSYMQTFEYFRYSSGKGQLIMISFNMIAAVANVLKFAGYSDGTEGIEFQLDGTTKQFKIYSTTSAGNQTVSQSSWNLDKLDGTGDSGITLDITKIQMLVIDFQGMLSGRARIGFNFGGITVYAHEFVHANIATYPAAKSVNLPVRIGMTCTGTVSTTMNLIGVSVMKEDGGALDPGYTLSLIHISEPTRPY